MDTLRRYLQTALFLLFLGIMTSCQKGPQDTLTTTNELSQALSEAKGQEIPFEDALILLEFNSTNNDLGLHLEIDAAEWDSFRVLDPNGQQIFNVTASGELSQLGLTSLLFESAEPSPDVVLGLFPPGEFSFRGRTLEGEILVANPTLSHELPEAPSVTPSTGQIVDPDDLEIKWEPVPGAVLYEVVFTNDESLLCMTVEVNPSVTSLPIPDELVEPNAEHIVEVTAIFENGNRSLTLVTFMTGDEDDDDDQRKL